MELRSYSSSKSKPGFFSSTKGPDNETRFEMVVGDKLIELAAPTRQDKADWLAALSKACECEVKDETVATFNIQGSLLKQSGGGKRSAKWDSRYLFRLCSPSLPLSLWITRFST